MDEDPGGSPTSTWNQPHQSPCLQLCCAPLHSALLKGTGRGIGAKVGPLPRNPGVGSWLSLAHLCSNMVALRREGQGVDGGKGIDAPRAIRPQDCQFQEGSSAGCGRKGTNQIPEPRLESHRWGRS